MDPRFDNDAQTTGTLPGIGAGALEPFGRIVQARAPGVAGGGESGSQRARALPRVTSRTAGVIVVPVSREWTRIGRSLAADIRFDDATVSRRHALVASEEAGVRVLDDRSLNGILVNGRRVEWSPLADGDELVDRPPHAVLPGHCVRAHSTADPAALDANSSPRSGAAAWPPTRSRSCRSRAARARPRPSAPWPTCSGASASTCWPIDLDPQGNLSDYFDVPPDASPTRRRRAVGRREGQGGDPRRRDRPGDAEPGRGRARR